MMLRGEREREQQRALCVEDHVVGKGVVDRVYSAPLYARLNRRTFHGQRFTRIA